MIDIFRSRHTPNVTGAEVDLQIGEKVKYRLMSGEVVEAIIKSERMSHDMCDSLGYEVLFLDTKERGFADGSRILGWSLD